MIGGTVVIENLFDIPGLGYFLVDSIKSRDYPVIQGCVLFIGFFVVIINTIADLLSLLIDPKQRYAITQKETSKFKWFNSHRKKVVTMKFKLSRKNTIFFILRSILYVLLYYNL